MTNWKIAALAAVVIFVAAYIAAPFLALNTLTHGLEEGDQAQLERAADFPAIRQSLKEQLKAQITASAAKKSDNLFSKLGAAVGLALVDPLIEACVTPAGIATVVKSAKVKPDQPNDPGTNAPSSGEKPPRVRRCWFVALDEFQVQYENGVKLRFQLRGWRWKLTAILLPAK